MESTDFIIADKKGTIIRRADGRTGGQRASYIHTVLD